MNIKINVDDRETLERLASLSMREKLEVWTEAVTKVIQEKAVQRLGGGQFGQDIADSVRSFVRGNIAVVYTQNKKTASNPNGYIGTAVHYGGDFRSHTRPYLALPLHDRFRRGGSEFGIFPRNSKLAAKHMVKGREVSGLIALRSKKGNLLLFERKFKGKPKETEGPLFLLRRSFHHRPRPWWITEAEAEAATREFIEDNF
jgi:hypothetical protein